MSEMDARYVDVSIFYLIKSALNWILMPFLSSSEMFPHPMWTDPLNHAQR